MLVMEEKEMKNPRIEQIQFRVVKQHWFHSVMDWMMTKLGPKVLVHPHSPHSRINVSVDLIESGGKVVINRNRFKIPVTIPEKTKLDVPHIEPEFGCFKIEREEKENKADNTHYIDLKLDNVALKDEFLYITPPWRTTAYRIPLTGILKKKKSNPKSS